MNQENSILDKIITSKQTSDISQFNPMEMVSAILKLISDKEEDILRRRYGINGKNEETLEEIGKFYQVTRERIRQVENTAIQKIKNNREFHSLINPVESIISNLIHQNGGIMEKEYFYNRLLGMIGESQANKNAINFILLRLLNEKYKLVADQNLRESWQYNIHSTDLLFKTIDTILKILEESGKPLNQEDLLKIFKEKDLFQQEANLLFDEIIISYLKTSRKISTNPYGDYGLTSWGSIKPKRINDKIYLIMKKYGKPLHFTKIAELINKANFDQKKAYPPTVHNELILNKEYILVGRGIYALKEWGYQPGVVVDVVYDILRQAGKPISRDELISKVLERRMVKKNTILLALTNKNKFKKLSDSTYALVD